LEIVTVNKFILFYGKFRGSMGRSFVARKAGSERCVYDGWFQSSGSSEMCNFDRFTELKTPYILYSKTTSAESRKSFTLYITYKYCTV